MSHECSQPEESIGQGEPVSEGTCLRGIESGGTSNFEVSEESSCESFERHLDPVIRVLIAGHGIHNLMELVDYTEAIETKWKELLEIKRTWVWKPKSASTGVGPSSGDVVEIGKKKRRENDQPLRGRQEYQPQFPLAKPGVSLHSQIICHKCSESGHFRNKCPRSEKPTYGCYACGQPGHVARNCPMGSAPRGTH